MCEHALVVAAKQGQSEAFGALCQPLGRKLIQSAHRITRNREDAEDAVQDALLRAFVHMGDFEGRSSFGTWLTSITVNSALMILRKKRASPEIDKGCNNDFGVGSLCYEIADHAPNPEKLCAQRERREILRGAIVQLRPKIRHVVELQQLQEHSLMRTAEMLGISLTAAKGRLFHARAALRKSSRLRAIAPSGESRTRGDGTYRF
jgi:RNA polymerase sigma-70 factor (ECF subfamily)